MSECEAYWIMDFPLILNNYGMHQELIMVISQIRQTNNYKEKIVISQSIGIIVIKSKETRVVTYTLTD